MQRTPAPILASLLVAASLLANPALAEPVKKPSGNKLPAMESWSVPADSYKDLPGVKSQAEIDRQNLKPSYNCSTETVLMQGRGTRDFHFLGSGMPRTVYRCTTGSSDDGTGVSYTGTQPPNTGAWLPGINPRDVGE
ncbi:hypothetical protein H4S14_000920 [Agrobacterium vitis]|nr:hypothetical protein [Agrobacterium vitis]MBE1437189.1 hypothetical protein [Agrobacterium vitis]